MDKLSTSVEKMDLSFELIKAMRKWILKQFPYVFLFCFHRYQPNLPHDSWSKYHKTLCGL